MSLEVMQKVRLSKRWAKQEGKRQFEGFFLYYMEGGFALVKLDMGQAVRVPQEDVEPYDPKPEEMVWLGDLSGWYVETKRVAYETGDLAYLTHRCGESHALDGGMNYMANMIEDYIKPHICK